MEQKINLDMNFRNYLRRKQKVSSNLVAEYEQFLVKKCKPLKTFIDKTLYARPIGCVFSYKGIGTLKLEFEAERKGFVDLYLKVAERLQRSCYWYEPNVAFITRLRDDFELTMDGNRVLYKQLHSLIRDLYLIKGEYDGKET
jgi:hypothetical protein